MDPVTLLGICIQYFKSLPFGGKMAKWQPVMALAFTALAGTGIFLLVTPGAMGLSPYDFLQADISWIQKCLGTAATASLLTQAGVNLGVFNGTSRWVPNSNPAMSVPVVTKT